MGLPIPQTKRLLETVRAVINVGRYRSVRSIVECLTPFRTVFGDGAGTAKAAGCFAQSAQVLQGMQQLVRLPAVAATARSMALEMEKMGLIQEMQDDMVDSVLEEEEGSEDDLDSDVENVIGELVKGDTIAAPAARHSRSSADHTAVPAATVPTTAVQQHDDDAAVTAEARRVAQRLEALKALETPFTASEGASAPATTAAATTTIVADHEE